MIRLLANLGLVEAVWLKDFDGTTRIAIKRKDPFGGHWAYAMTPGVGHVILEPNGTCTGRSTYVKKWMDYKPIWK